jgi:hypothetical protein
VIFKGIGLIDIEGVNPKRLKLVDSVAQVLEGICQCNRDLKLFFVGDERLERSQFCNISGFARPKPPASLHNYATTINYNPSQVKVLLCES